MWRTKSKDDQFTVEVKVVLGKEIGQYRYKHKDGSITKGLYVPTDFPKMAWQLSRAGLLAGGFLVGLLLEWFTRVLK